MTTIHLVSHTHWDREWYLTFQQFRLKLVHLIDHLLELLDHDPDYLFFLLDGQTILLEDYLEIRPDRRVELARHISAGRILIGPWYISPDEFLVSPESHIRNLLEGDKLCRSFGVKMKVGYLPDDFGHIGQMPQILRGFGIESACLWRGLDDEACEMEWQAPDGSRVLLSYLRDSYSNAASLTTSIPDKFADDINTLSASLLAYSVTSNILLMQGTDHMEPVDSLSGAIEYYQHHREPNNLVHSNLPLYFNTLRSHLASTDIQLPVVCGELRSSRHSALLQNVLSTRMWLKQRNHSCETELLKWVEPLNAWTNLLRTTALLERSDKASPTNAEFADLNSIIRHAWKLLLQCHPHDSICGTSIDQVADEMRIRFDQVDQISHALVDQCLENICDRIDTSCEDDPAQGSAGNNILSAIVVFNPNDAFQSGLINLSLKLAGHYSAYEILDGSGQAVPCDFSGMGSHELISLILDKKALKQAFGMIHEGHVVGMVVRDFEIEKHDSYATVRATLSDHGSVNIHQWNEGIEQMDAILADSAVKEFHIHAYSDPEIQISFVAREIPQHGFGCYWIRGKVSTDQELVKPVRLNPVIQAFIPLMARAAQIPMFSRLLGGKKRRATRLPKRIENEYFVVEAHASNGTLTVTDKLRNQVYTGLNKLIDGSDRGDLYNYCPSESDQLISPQLTRVEHEEGNTYKKLTCYFQLSLPASLSIDRRSRGHDWISNPIICTITLISGVPRIDIHTEIDNQAHDHRLRVHFPAPFSCAEAVHDGHFEFVNRPIGIQSYDDTWAEPPRPEVPQRQFTSITDGRLSLTIASLGLPEVEAFKNLEGHSEIAVTLLRCVSWLSRDDLATRKGHAGPMELAVPGAQMIGKLSFDYSIILGGADWRESIPQAASFNAPLRSITTPMHTGMLPPYSSLIEKTHQDFMITTIKTAEDGTGLIVRGYNNNFSPIDVSLKPIIPVKQVHLARLDESIIEIIPVTPDGSINLQVGGYKIVTIRILC